MKITPWEIRIRIPRIVELLTRKVCELFAHKNTETIEHAEK